MFSVVMPVWNKRHTISRSVESVLAQNFTGFELIIVDDGSSDGSIDHVNCRANSRIRILSQPNCGPGRARNTGIEAARYEWVAFIDADDVWLPGHLAELDRIRRLHPEAGLIGTRFVDSDWKGRVCWPEEQHGLIEEICYFDTVGRGPPPLFTSSAAAPAALLRALGGFAPFPRGEDSHLWVRIALSHNVARSTLTTVAYVHGTGGITETIRTPWPGNLPAGPEQLSPAVAAVLEAYPKQPLQRRVAMDRFVDRYVDWMVKASASRGEPAAVRLITSFNRGPAPFAHRLLRVAAKLPGPLGRFGVRAANAATLRLRLLDRRTGRVRPTPSNGQPTLMPTDWTRTTPAHVPGEETPYIGGASKKHI